jgi:arylsulfatase A-like enzyme
LKQSSAQPFRPAKSPGGSAIPVPSQRRSGRPIRLAARVEGSRDHIRCRTRALALALVAGAVVGLSACRAPPQDIVLVTLDTLRRDHVGAYGDARGLTPNLDRLAQSGLVHEAAYTTMPTTGPAHLSLFTGLYPSELGATRNADVLTDQHAPRELARMLAARGYATAAFVTSTLAGPYATGLRGFDVYDQQLLVLRSGAAAVDDALAWLASESEGVKRPIFLWVHIYDPHAPYGDTNQKRLSFPLDPELYGWIDPAHFASGEVAARTDQLYRDGVRLADAELGRLLKGVQQQRGQATLVIVAADHGESLSEHVATRGYAYDHGEFLDPEAVRIPLVLAGPGISPGRSTGAVSIRDLYTTVLEAAGIHDATAAAEGRRDLRKTSSQLRIVEIERRSFSERQPPLVESHYGGASDGDRIVVAGADGELTSGAEGASAELIAAASERARKAALAARQATPDFSPETIEALRSLGYAP